MDRREGPGSPVASESTVRVEDRRRALALRRVIDRLVADGLGEVVGQEGARRVVASRAAAGMLQMERVAATDEMLARQRPERRLERG